MKKVAIGLLVAAIGAASNGTASAWNEGGGEQEEAMRLSPDPLNGMEVFDACTACHLPEGWGKLDGTVPQLAGQHRSVLIKQLSDIRANKRDNPASTMYPYALPEAIGGVQDLADVAAYLEIMPMNPQWGKGPWKPDTSEYVQGQQLYEENCLECHGKAGMGDAEQFFPRINGQHQRYVLRQLHAIRDGKRRNANLEMIEESEDLTDEEMRLIANYVSWQQVPKDQLAAGEDREPRRLATSGY